MEKQTKADMYRNAAKLLEVNAPEYAEMLLEDAKRIEARNASRRNVNTKKNVLKTFGGNTSKGSIPLLSLKNLTANINTFNNI